MPAVAYYLGRPARIWIAAMSSSARATAANPGRHRIPGQPGRRAVRATAYGSGRRGQCQGEAAQDEVHIGSGR